jgi:hypothetical protein
MKVNLLATYTLVAIGLFSTQALSGRGSTGGGNALIENGAFLDLDQNRHSQPLDTAVLKNIAKDDLHYLDQILAISKLPNENHVRSIELARNDYAVSYVFSKIFDKRWLLTKNEISGTDCLNNTIYKAEKKIVACQNDLQVVVNEAWFYSQMANDGHENIRWMIMHEMLVDQALKYNPQIVNSQAIIDINQLIMGKQSVEILIRYLNHYRLGEFITKREHTRRKIARAEAERRKQAFIEKCQAASIDQDYDKFIRFVEENTKSAPSEMIFFKDNMKALIRSYDHLLSMAMSEKEKDKWIYLRNRDLKKSASQGVQFFCAGNKTK